MTITVGANSYVTEAEFIDYATDRGITLPTDTETPLIKAMDWLEVRPFIGSKTDPDQALEWPRGGSDVVPGRIETAQMVAALLIIGGVDLYATVPRAVKRERVGPLEVEYQDHAANQPTYPQLADLLRGLVRSGGVSPVQRL